MICKKCGMELSEGIKYCPECGEPLNPPINSEVSSNNSNKDDSTGNSAVGIIGSFLAIISIVFNSFMLLLVGVLLLFIGIFDSVINKKEGKWFFIVLFICGVLALSTVEISLQFV